MSALVEPVADVVEALVNRGFKFIKRLDGAYLLFGGTFRAEGETYECEVLVDTRFIRIPVVRLLELPRSLPAAVEHLNSDGYLCYLTQSTVVVDVFDPVGQTLAFLERAEFVFQQVLKRELVNDLEEEFFAYWGGLTCYLDVQGSRLGQQSSLMIGDPKPHAIAVTDDLERTRLKLKTIGLAPAGGCVPAYRIRTAAKPRPARGSWPPKTLGDILNWQQVLDPNCRKKIEQRVEEAWRARHRGAVILVKSPLLVYGFVVLFDHALWLQGRREKQVNRRSFEVVPLSTHHIDAQYVTQRNTPGQATLAGKNVTLVGCGTIGGYLADLLVRAGAGTDGGTLTLVDNDQFLPQNVGRHRLGFPHLLRNKAEALADELRNLMPGASVRALPVAVQVAHLGAVDLLIDATGEESISHWLAGKYAASTALLSVWIEGPGTAVRSLLRATNEGGCPRCLFEHNRQGRFRAVKGGTPQIYAGQGCEGLYVPFSATVSLQAAALGADAAVAWANGKVEPALRTRLTDSSFELATPDGTVPAFEGCPACSL